jgi:transketolase
VPRPDSDGHADEDLGRWYAEHGLSSRVTCRQAQLDLAHADERIFALDADLAVPAVPFPATFPERYVQLGICEANMLGVATGLALRGKVPFVNTFSAFVTFRACEQVRLDVAYHRANVKLVGAYAGISGGPAGPTHHCIEDIAVLRAMPNMVVLSPADALEAYKAVQAAAEHDGPVYVRVGRAETPAVYSRDYTFEIGKAVRLLPGDDVTIVATGPLVHAAREASSSLRAAGISCGVLNVHTIKPLDREQLVAAALQTGALVTVEEHTVHGGLGTAVAEALLAVAPVPIVRVGLGDRFCEFLGPYEDMLAAYGLDAAGVVEGVRRVLQLKERTSRAQLARRS